MSDRERQANAEQPSSGPPPHVGLSLRSWLVARKRSWRLLLVPLLVVGLALVLWVLHARAFVWTDDARVERTVTAVAPRITGRLVSLTVDTGDGVAGRQVVARLDDRDLRAALGEAQAGVRAGQAHLARATAALALQRTATRTQTEAAASGTAAGRAKVAQAEKEAELQQATLRERLSAAESVVAQSAATLEGMEGQQRLTAAQVDVEVDQAEQALAAARARLAEAEIGVRLAQKQTTHQTRAAQEDLNAAREHLRELQKGARPQEIAEAQADVDSAQAQEENARADLGRLGRLYSRGAVSAQELDAARTRARTAAASLKRSQEHLALLRAGPREEQIKAAQAQVARAEAGVSLAQSGEDEVGMRQEEVRWARAAVEQAEKAAELARAQRLRVLIAERQTEAGRAEKVRTQAAARQTAAERLGVEAKRSEVAAARANLRQQQAALEAALAGPEEVKQKEADLAAAQAELKQAQARLEAVGVELAETTIYSPLAGTVVQKLAEVGEVVEPGQPLLAVASRNEVWVIANFEETKVRRIGVGQPARFTVDALGREAFTGRVIEVRAGTQAAFALFPTGNPEGSYTKLVQRVPVKIALTRPDPRLAVGLSVVVEVDVRKR